MKKKKKWPVVLIAVAVAAVMAGAVWFFAGDIIANQYVLRTSTDEEYLEYYVKKLVGRIENIRNVYTGKAFDTEIDSGEAGAEKACPEGTLEAGISLNGTELARANFMLTGNRAVFGSIPEYREDYVRMGYLLWDEIAEADAKSIQEKTELLLSYVNEVEIDRRINGWKDSENVRCSIKVFLDLPGDVYVTLYTALNGDPIGLTVGFTLGEAKLEADISLKTVEALGGKLELELEAGITGFAVNMADCKLRLSFEGDTASAELDIKPGSFLLAFVGGLEKADIRIEATAEKKKVEAPDTPYDLFELTESDYIILEKAIGFGLDLYDRMDENLRAYAASALFDALGIDLDIESIRAMYEAGMFGMGSEDAQPVEESKPNEESKPAEESKPNEESKANVESDPNEESKPNEEVQPAGEIKPNEEVQPADGQPDEEEISQEETREETEQEENTDREIEDEKEEEEKPAPEEELTADYGDALIMDITPILYGALIRDMTQTDVYAVLGENSLGENLDDKMIGVKVGEERDVYAVLGEEYGDFAGYEGTFRVKVKEIRR